MRSVACIECRNKYLTGLIKMEAVLLMVLVWGCGLVEGTISGDEVKQLSYLLVKGAHERLSESEKDSAIDLFGKLLPKRPVARWVVHFDHPYDESYDRKYADGEGDRHPPGFRISLYPKRDFRLSYKLLDIRVLYHIDPPPDYGDAEFKGYGAYVSEGKFYHILVGNIELQIGARASEYRDDRAFREFVEDFNLVMFERL